MTICHRCTPWLCDNNWRLLRSEPKNWWNCHPIMVEIHQENPIVDWLVTGPGDYTNGLRHAAGLVPNTKPQNLIWASNHSLAVKVIIYVCLLTYSWQLTNSCCAGERNSRSWQLHLSKSVTQSIIWWSGITKKSLQKSSICKTTRVTLHLTAALRLLILFFAVIENIVSKGKKIKLCYYHIWECRLNKH